ncbi:MAG: (deoxy)nucleoside triphosphate pyrophosphohydrolase [Polyangiaceae bacterium]
MKTVIVSAGVILEKGRVLLTQRKVGAHLEGLWEFPGGKVESGEDPRDALVRELREELGIAVTVGEAVDVTFHRYDDADKSVLLIFFDATRTENSADPSALDVAAYRWAGVADLDALTFPPADGPIVTKVRTRLIARAEVDAFHA